MTHESSRPPIDILMVEDSETDVILMREALDCVNVAHVLHVVEDGVHAMEFLGRHGHRSEAPRPDLILLDLNMPRKNGQEVLAEIKTNAELKAIPVIILTTSNAEADVLKAYNNHANCYIQKPMDFDSFIEVARAIENHWFTVVTLPSAAA